MAPLLVLVAGCAGEVGTLPAPPDSAPPDGASCRELLDFHGVDYEPGPEQPGVEDPVTVTPPIAGIAYRGLYQDAPRETFFMDCELALSLVRAAPMLGSRDIVEVADLGVYNYRCIGGEGTPPDCPRGVSWHAYAKAIDIAGFTTGDGLYYSVEDDWVIDPESEPTCEAGTEGGADTLLHELICELKAQDVWNIVLTPNYNSAHRNHFHVDLTDGGDFLRRQTSPRSVDEGPDRH